MGNITFFKKKIVTLLLLFTATGVLLHFYNLSWGAPFYFHPDERNIASSVSQLRFPEQMHPHFFAYGALPIYTIYFTGFLSNLLQQAFMTSQTSVQQIRFEEAILISRFYSALFATLLIPLLFFIGKKIANVSVGLLASFFAVTSVGFIQFAHFGTFEMWLTFFTTVLFWLSLQKLTLKNLLFMGIIFGILVATKISSLILLFLLLFVIPFFGKMKNRRPRTTTAMILRKYFFLLLQLTFLLIIAFLVYMVTNPFVFLDYQAFRGTLNYESSLVIGTLPVFYTGEFYDTIPVFFQFFSEFPFLLNPLLTILFIPSFCYLFFLGIHHKKYSFLLLSSFFIILFASQAFFFAKWTRYLVPTLPFMYLIIAFTLIDTIPLSKKIFYNKYALIGVTAVTCSIFALAFFVTAFIMPDTRLAAKQAALRTIPSDAAILSEVYDLGITPFNDRFNNITLFNFYDLDNNSLEYNEATLQQELQHSDYIILPSQRLIKTRLMHKEQFPKGNAFYKKLTSGELGFQKIYETPCDLFCQITYLGNPVYRLEQTVNVFDRPTVYIFKKI